MLNGYWWSSGNNDCKGLRWLSWDALSVIKCKGGLGFKSMYRFNIALLRKKFWNFINNPELLVSRVFKARYFVDSHFIHAKKGQWLSFIWSCICSAKEELLKGFRWVIVDGIHIVAVRDAWLRNKSDFVCGEKPYV